MSIGEYVTDTRIAIFELSEDCHTEKNTYRRILNSLRDVPYGFVNAEVYGQAMTPQIAKIGDACYFFHGVQHTDDFLDNMIEPQFIRRHEMELKKTDVITKEEMVCDSEYDPLLNAECVLAEKVCETDIYLDEALIAWVADSNKPYFFYNPLDDPIFVATHVMPFLKVFEL
jgi:hypothetical protein